MVSESITGEAFIKADPELVWLRVVAIEPKDSQILALSISGERDMFVAEGFVSALTRICGKHPASTDGGGTWHPQACGFLKVTHHHHIHSTPGEKPD